MSGRRGTATAEAGALTRGLLIGGGVAAPAAFFVIALVAGATEPGYSPLEDHLSGLAAIPATNRWLMTAGFVLLGLGVALVAAAIARIQGPGQATALLAAAGLAAVLIGLLPRSCVEVACTDPAWHHRLHDGFSVPGYAALLVMPLVLARRTDLGASRRVAGGVVALTTVLAALFAADLLTDLGGLIQRLVVLAPLAWLAAVTTRAARQPSSSRASSIVAAKTS